MERDFDSYFDELITLEDEALIAAFWERMDEIIENFSEAKRITFFQQMEVRFNEDNQEFRKFLLELEASLPQNEQTEGLRQLLTIVDKKK